MNDKKQLKTIDEQALNEKALIALASELASIKQANRQIQEKTNAFLIKSIEHCKKYGDTSLFKKVFFLKIGKVYLYNALSLKAYFSEQGVFFEYKASKDSLRIFGNWKEIQESYKEYLERKKKEKQASLLNETKEEKIQRLFKNKVESLSNTEIVLLKAYLKTVSEVS